MANPVKCPDCGKSYAPSREECPHCGALRPRAGRGGPSGTPAPVFAGLMVLAMGAGAMATWAVMRTRPEIHEGEKTPAPPSSSGAVAAAPTAPDEPSPFPYDDDEKVTAEAKEQLKANYDDPHGGHVLQNLRSKKFPNDPDGAAREALEYFRRGVRNRWRLGGLLMERAQVLGLNLDTVLEATCWWGEIYGTDGSQSVKLPDFLLGNAFDGVTADDFDRKVIGGELAHYPTSKILDDALMRAAQRLEAKHSTDRVK